MRIFSYYIIVFLSIFLFSCSEEDVEVFKDRHEVYFDKFFINESYPGTNTADSTVVSFFFYPDGTNDATVDLFVHLSGDTLTSDLHYGLKVVEEETTAEAGEYTIAPLYTFHAGNLIDTVKVKLHRSDRLESLPDGVRIVVELVPGETMGVGQIERRRAKIILTTAVSMPDWWKSASSLLGKYSPEKYKLFLNHADKEAQVNARFIRENPDKTILLVLKFKKWLSEQNPAIQERDGSLMTVSI
ncbi:DUF4843 domain-containing protein [uncultured Butyricimonas sp.]|uniref:DUF4843 domain-containing protein n=1 Tax=uncultured Butyricimonas sp. TaxID=1268785 RepID=UPI0026DD2B78|nr:DUF4843 domain-containing protein [uncultured Butyricimonas sp.]